MTVTIDYICHVPGTKLATFPISFLILPKNGQNGCSITSILYQGWDL